MGNAKSCAWRGLNTHTSTGWGADWLESIFAEKALVVLVDNKLNIRQYFYNIKKDYKLLYIKPKACQ